MNAEEGHLSLLDYQKLLEGLAFGKTLPTAVYVLAEDPFPVDQRLEIFDTRPRRCASIIFHIYPLGFTMLLKPLVAYFPGSIWGVN